MAATRTMALAMAMTLVLFGSARCDPNACDEAPPGAFRGTATLSVAGLHNHETIEILFNDTSAQTLFVSGWGDTSHTITFPPCGPIAWHRGISGPGACQAHLDSASWSDSVCARHHYLTKKIRNLRLYWSSRAALQNIKMTADVYTVWPLGWKKVSWNLERVEDNAEEPNSEF
ncbi:hypothetical protein HKI87_09g59770 [Chloropicon roscoffensis]|uniref:Uncharacterized protein n=1 Tax=Chloropicon roscoffensis TaxID=1461544 RepID=A0AAX4PEE4_9CHLO